jgi:aminoglycoside/choline kinase family phosphotransferase
MDELQALFLDYFNAPADRVEPVQGLGASARKIVRLANDASSAIGIHYDVRRENEAFLAFSRHFRRHGLPVPGIYATNLDKNIYLEEDLGDTTLYRFLQANRDGESIAESVIDAYRKVVRILPRFQVDASRDLDYAVCYPRDRFDERSIAWDLNYFKYFFLTLAGVEFDEQALEDDFARLTTCLIEAESDYFLYRDFQSRNIMIRDHEPYFLDYQGGRRGALQYDIASLLYDAKADLPPALRQELLEAYLDALSDSVALDPNAFKRHFYPFVFVRIMQSMGAYGYRGFHQRKPLFLESVPFALANIEWLLGNVDLPVSLPELTAAFRRMLDSEHLRSVDTGDSTVTVRIFSFSYHRDRIEDDSGNGGGFVFDARCLPNPGREAIFTDRTGKDADVIGYLSNRPEVSDYFSGAASLVDSSIGNYRRRGFSDLVVAFGCTGGQHRSVYLAEQLAAHLGGREGVQVRLRHLGLERMGR